MQILKTGHKNMQKIVTWKQEIKNKVKKSQRKKWLKNANLENGS